MIYAGALNEYLSFYKLEETQTPSGFKRVEEVLLCRVRASRTKDKGKYTVDAEELFHTNELNFRLRIRKDVDETCTVEYNNRRYRILSLQKWYREGDMTITLGLINE
jgi:head-tail adaptor